MVAWLLLSETVCFDRWKARLPMVCCVAASWQRRCGRWLANGRSDVEALYSPLILWAIEFSWQLQQSWIATIEASLSALHRSNKLHCSRSGFSGVPNSG
jgi:hypothetical protein